VNRFMSKDDNDHQDRMALCQLAEPCFKNHRHGPDCYTAKTIMVSLQRFLAEKRSR